MKRLICVGTLFLCALPCVAQKGLVFKPNDKIRVTVSFDHPIEAGVNVGVNFTTDDAPPPSAVPLDQSIIIGGDDKSTTDHKTYHLEYLVRDNQSPGKYVFRAVNLTKDGYMGSGSDKAETPVPDITIENNTIKPTPRLQPIPGFKVEVK